MISLAYNMDCMEAMAQMPDNCFDLAVVDPPYGIERLKRKSGRLEKYGDTTIANNNMPTEEYFKELFRVSQNQIIWGGNYFNLPPCRCFIVWYKHQPIDNYSDCEFAWTSYQTCAKCFDYPYFGNIGADKKRIHPTQKPVALYAWLYQQYAKLGDKILDTHLGSGSSRIAAYKLGLDFVGFELDKHYFDLQEQRFVEEQRQLSFDFK